LEPPGRMRRFAEDGAVGPDDGDAGAETSRELRAGAVEVGSPGPRERAAHLAGFALEASDEGGDLVAFGRPAEPRDAGEEGPADGGQGGQEKAPRQAARATASRGARRHRSIPFGGDYARRGAPGRRASPAASSRLARLSLRRPLATCSRR